MAKKAASRSAKTAPKAAAAPETGGSAPASRGRGRSRGPSRGLGYVAGAAKGKSLVIVESPSKAKTINKYLGRDYVVLASIGHVRDLPSKNPKGVKSPVPGVDLEHRFRPTYEILPGKEKVIADLKRAAKDADQVWFATDLDREGEAIAWHLAQELQIPSDKARRVMFAAITKSEIDRAFGNPHPIDEDRV
ncbi:MAG: type I DNA topoisomerase, partial [Gemmatimonadetes bacterium]|nr:type I DNA topoisomerase [Gemmatimonadota bacterium]